MSELMKTSLPFSMNFRLQKQYVYFKNNEKSWSFLFSPFGVTVLEIKFVVNRAENIKANLKF